MCLLPPIADAVPVAILGCIFTEVICFLLFDLAWVEIGNANGKLEVGSGKRVGGDT